MVNDFAACEACSVKLTVSSSIMIYPESLDNMQITLKRVKEINKRKMQFFYLFRLCRLAN